VRRDHICYEGHFYHLRLGKPLVLNCCSACVYFRSEDFRDFLLHCLIKDPTQRLSASELLQVNFSFFRWGGGVGCQQFASFPLHKDTGWVPSLKIVNDRDGDDDNAWS